jgi:branched-chain amino acid transport system permease protein
MKHYKPVLIVALGAAALITIFWNGAATQDILLGMGTVSLLAISLGLVYGQAGMLSIAQGAFAAIGAYTTAIMTLNFGWPIWLGFIGAIILPAAVAYALARVVVRLSALALAVSTLLIGEVTIYAITAGGEVTGGFIGLSGIPSPSWMFTPQSKSLVAWAMVCLATLLVITITRSQYGRALRAISTDDVLAKSMGINVSARLSAIFALGGAIAGSAGWLYAHTRSFLAPDSFPILLSLEVVMMVIIGGRRRALGPVLGTVLLMWFLNLLPGAETRGLFYGLILIAAILVFPNGLLGASWKKLRARAAPKPRDQEPSAISAGDEHPEIVPEAVK